MFPGKADQPEIKTAASFPVQSTEGIYLLYHSTVLPFWQAKPYKGFLKFFKL